MNVRSGSGIAGNPVLIGAATTLIVIVAVFLAYNANQGLPFVPTYQLKVQAPSAANLVRGNEVRIGGARVGAVTRIEARRRPDGTSYALLTLELERDAQPLPDDSTVIIRPRSALGLKYVQLDRGSSRRGFPDGATIPLAASRPEQVEIDEFLNMFDDRTRSAMQRNLTGFGTAFAGRGADLNTAIGELRPLLRDVEPLARTLAAPETDLRGFVRSLARAAEEVAPVARQQAELFANLETTFRALSAVAPQIQETITAGRPALDTAIRSLPAQRPFLENSTRLFAELRPGARALRGAAPDLAAALTAGTPALRQAVGLNQRLEPVFTTLRSFAEDPVVPRGIRRLDDTVETLRPTLDFVAPAQLTCNYVSLLLRNGASVLSEGDDRGTWQRFNIVATPQGPNNEGGPASAPANGPQPTNHLHSNPYPNTAAPGQPRECEPANEPYLAGRTVIGNVPGTQQATTEKTTEASR
ncbi:MAG TPA: MlaD family protein [Solirubrobacteraceae bacterium]